MQPYFILTSHDDTERITGSLGIRPSRWQSFLLPPGIIAVIDSVLVGAFVGLLVSFVFALSVPIGTGVGVVAFLMSVGIHQRHHWKYCKRLEQSIPVMFPSEERR